MTGRRRHTASDAVKLALLMVIGASQFPPVPATAQSASPATTAAVGMVDDPCPVMPAEPPSVRALAEAMLGPAPADVPALLALTQQPDFQTYDAAKKAREARDWAGLCVYRADNARIIASGVRPDVVMMGDSITENWARAVPDLIDGVRIVGRGIGGQTSGQMLVRFQADVLSLRPRRVHLMAGTNDVAGNGGPTSPDAYRNNIVSMTELARANGVEVVLAAIPPANRFFWNPAIQPAPRIAELNAWLKAYAEEKGYRFIDYVPALADDRRGMRSDYSIDGVHPNRAGYAAMRDLLIKAMEKTN